jgi:hypothetical protein
MEGKKRRKENTHRERKSKYFPGQKAEECRGGWERDLGDLSPELPLPFLKRAVLLDDGLEQGEPLLPEEEEVDEGAEDVDDTGAVGAEEVAEI